MRRIAALVLFAAAAHGASLAEKIERLLDTTPAARAGFWGIQIVDLQNGKTLYEFNPALTIGGTEYGVCM